MARLHYLITVALLASLAAARGIPKAETTLNKLTYEYNQNLLEFDDEVEDDLFQRLEQQRNEGMDIANDGGSGSAIVAVVVVVIILLLGILVCVLYKKCKTAEVTL